MAINLNFDLIGNPEPPSIILANRNGNKLGQLDVSVESIDLKDSMKTSEMTFTLNKYINGKITNLWDKVLDFKLVYCPEWDLWYEIKVELDEATETIKTVFCTQLGQAELSQIRVYNTEINTEDDIARDDYKISILYDEDNPDASIFHRVMSKAPHYSIAHVDESLKRIQRSFSFDDSSICDVFDEIEEEVGCLVVYNSNSDKNGMPKRDISVYDLYQHCDDCGHREEFIGSECPKCHSKNIIEGYGKDTTIFVTADELATEGIHFDTDIDSVKNCFKLEAGDDLMTATIRNCNPNGSDYIWYFSDAVKEDMSKELVKAIESYNAKYKEYYNDYSSNLDENLINEYNALVDKYKGYYNTKSTCIDCDYEGEFENECPSCHSENILAGKSLQTIDTPITGYPALMNAYYNTIDLSLYLNSGLMPNVEMSDTTAEEQLGLLTTSSLSPVAVNVDKIENVSLATANSAVLSMAKVIVRPTYKVEIKTSTLSNDKVWSGQFIITNHSDDSDTATNDDGKYVNVIVNNDEESFIKQKIKKALNKENTDDLSISVLFNEEKYDYNAFCKELKKYALNPLKSLYDACDACISILTEQGAGDKKEKEYLYKSLYDPYYKRSQAIANEIKIRENEIAVINGVYDETDEDNKVLISKGLQTNIIECQNEIQEKLNFENYLGKDLWLEFCAYRREDKYSNSNYISDGLNNAELFKKANEFIEVAEEEIFKSAELQHSISTTLNNLLSLPKFKHLIKSFKTGNWIRVQVDDKIYKLRLLEYDFSYGEPESISVEFSDVTKVKNGITDVESVISQAASIASSYDSVQRQAKKGDVARSTIDQWLVDGLKSADVQIKSNDSEEVLITKNGLLARSYDDITGGYSSEQLKITHNIMAYTDDNWETVKQAIGKHKYSAYDEESGKIVDNKIGYGMSAEFVTAGVVSGSQIIGGDIYSDNYSITEKKGSYLNLRDGTFSFGGGTLRFEGGELLISSPNVLTKNEVTTINEEYLKTTSVYAENLKVTAANIQEKLTASQINTKGLIAENISSTTIDGKTITGGSILIGDTTKVKDYAEITNNGELICTNIDIQGGTLKLGSKDDENSTHTWISEDGTLNTYNANISGEIRSSSIKSGTIEGTNITGCTINGTNIVGGYLYIGNDDTGYSAWISEEDGILNANGANISGTINAIDGSIAGWQITSDALYKNTNGISSGMCSIKMKPSEGLEYTLSDDESYYIVSGIGTCYDERIVIPDMYNGLSVQEIGNEAFKDNKSIKEVLLSDSIVIINSHAFNNCDNLESVIMTDNVTHIKKFAFTGCDKLTSMFIPINVVNIGEGAFASCTNLKEVVIPNSVVVVGFGAFNGNDTICCEAESKPDGWDGSWAINVQNIEWNYDKNKPFASLVKDGDISYPRFYAGCRSNKPNNLNDATFLVLEDGSFYASAAQINGSGTFDGEIYAESGKIGGLIFDEQEISSGEGGLTFTQDGLIKAKNLEISDYFEAESLRIGKISGRDSNSAILNLEASSQNSRNIEVTFSIDVVDKGSSGLFGLGFDKGEMVIKAESNYSLSKSKTFTVLLQYNIVGSGRLTYKTVTITIQSGKKSASKSVAYRVGTDSYDYCTLYEAFIDNSSGNHKDIDTIQTVTYTEMIPTSTSTITSSGSIAPTKTGLSLGSLSNPWSQIFIDTQYNFGGEAIDLSDRNKKNTIEYIDEKYSVLFDALRPVTFKLNNGTSGRTHVGLIAQEVKESMDIYGIDGQDFAAYCSWKDDDGNESCGIRYGEFVSLCIDQIQKLKKRVVELENKI